MQPQRYSEFVKKKKKEREKKRQKKRKLGLTPPCWNRCKIASRPLILMQQHSVLNKPPNIERYTQYDTHIPVDKMLDTQPQLSDTVDNTICHNVRTQCSAIAG